MKIEFKEVRWKNFLATGDVFNKVSFQNGKNILITGKNGEGKSQFEDALCFTLFNKSFRNVPRNNLVNSKNKAGLVTEVDFNIGKDFYTVSRGVKPALFDIIKNGVKIDKDSSVWDQQTFLEKTILRMSFKTFVQVVILGSASYVPFMKLTTSQRRDVVEDLLDIKVFSSMYQILKDKIRDNLNSIDNLINSIETSNKIIDVKKKHLDSLNVNIDNIINSYKKKKDLYIDEIQKNSKSINELTVKIDNLIDKISGTNILSEKLSEFKSEKNILKSNLKKYQKNMKFYDLNDSCPTCKQVLTESLKSQKVGEDIIKSKETIEDIKNQDINIKKLSLLIEKVEAISKRLLELKSQRIKKENSNNMLNNSLEQIKLDIDRVEGRNYSDIEILTNEIKILESELELSTKKLSKCKNRDNIYSMGSILLKDGGIKSSIIKRYLPSINQHIAKYLEEMGFYVSFELDDKFNETIKSRYLDEFAYGNFSEGEKKRIDLAVLFAWRSVAKLKNSVNTNILVLDEILDSSLDSEGVGYLYEIISKAEKDTSTVVISHRDVDEELFDIIIKVEKEDGYSIMEELK